MSVWECPPFRFLRRLHPVLDAQPAFRFPVVAVIGPTGTGKTALSMELARELDGEVVNADAFQFYRGMDIGTAKATVQQRQEVPHHLLDIMDLSQEASVVQFQQQARECFAQIRQRSRVPILVGGSGLYVRAALDQIDFPGTDPEVRRRVEHDLEQHGPEFLRDRLRRVDPESASRIHDNRRLVRAIEVYELTGRPFTAFMPTRTYSEPTVQIAVNVDRQLLYRRLEQRVHSMVDNGWEQEVRSLAVAGLRTSPTASRAIGYSQLLAVIDGTMTRDEAVASTVTATRQFAKRQLTWFRADPRVHWVAGDDPLLVKSAIERIRRTNPAD